MRRWRIILLTGVVVVGLYYLTIPVIGPHFAEVCSKGQYGPPDQCSSWDIVTASVLRLFVWLDGHNGFVAALASVVIAIFTAVLWRATDKTAALAEQTVALAGQQVALEGLQTDVLEKQKEIARQQYLAEHRPKLVLKDVFFSGDTEFGEVSFEIANSGGVIASITGGFIALDFVADPREFKAFEGRSLEPLDKHTGFLPGAPRPFAIRTRPLMQQQLATMRETLPFPDVREAARRDGAPSWPGRPLYFFGIIYYTDERGQEFGVTRASVFRRRWNPEIGSFERTGNPDHEYAD